MVRLGLADSLSRDAAIRRSRRRGWITEILGQLGQKIESPRRSWLTTRQRLVHAGYRQPSALPVYLGARIVAAGLLYFYIVFISLAFGASPGMAIFFGVWGGAAGWIVPSFLVSRRITRRQRDITKVLPDAIDLLVICVEAGLALNQAFQRVAVEIRHASELLSSEISQMNLEIRAGTPRDQALMGLGERTGVGDVRSLATMLVQTERFGTSIADSLRIHADTMRTKRQQRAEEAAAKTTIKMVFPLAICIFPAMFVVILGPAIIDIISALRSVA
jgi:tight adherence protein C